MAAIAALHRCNARDAQDVTRSQIHGRIPCAVSSIATTHPFLEKLIIQC